MLKMGKQSAIWLGIVVSFWAAGCGGSSGGGTQQQKTTPTVSAWPTASAITYGQTLASSTLSGGSASVSGTFGWTSSAVAPGAGTPSEGVTFTPADLTDYNTVAGSVGVVVKKATPTVTAWPATGRIHLRLGAGFGGVQRRHGVGAGHFRMDDASNGAGRWDGQRGRDLHANRYD